MENLSTLRNFLLHTIHTLCDAEKVVSETLFQTQAIAWAENVKTFLEAEYKEKKRQLERLEIIMAIFKIAPEDAPDELVRYLHKNMLNLVNKPLEHTVSDHILIMENRVIPRHLIHCYQTAINCSLLIEPQEATRILQRSLLAEKEIEKKLQTTEVSLSTFASMADIYE